MRIVDESCSASCNGHECCLEVALGDSAVDDFLNGG